MIIFIRFLKKNLAMKRFFLLLAAVLMLFATGCKKTPKTDPQKPAITWDSNPTFNIQEMTNGVDGFINVSAPEKINSLTITLTLGDYFALANNHIGLSANRGTISKSPVFDLVDDTKCAAFMESLGMTAGTILRGKTSVDLNLAAILGALLENQAPENNTTFALGVYVMDQAGNELSRTATFHFTSAPEFAWAGNTTFRDVVLDEDPVDCKIAVYAPGKIVSFTVTLADDADPDLQKKIKNRTTAGVLVIDLVNDEKVAGGFKFPAIASVVDAENVTLDFSFLYEWKYDMSPSTNKFTITVSDKNGKTSSQVIKFLKK